MTVNRVRFPGAAGDRPSSMWTRANGWGGYTNPGVDLDGLGNLRLSVSKNLDGTYTRCRVDTHSLYAVPPGSYVEFTALLPTVSGCFPGLFLVGNADGVNGRRWPGVGELDLAEIAGNPNIVKANVISSTFDDQTVKMQTGWPHSDTTVTPGWHRYGCYFDASVVVFTIDGAATYTYTKAQRAVAGASWPFGDPSGQYLALSFGVGGVGGDPSASSWPQSLLCSGIDIST